MKLYAVRYPEDHINKMKDLALNKRKKPAEVFREAVADYLSTYSTIPSLKEVSRQVETHEKRLIDIEKALLKKGIIE